MEPGLKLPEEIYGPLATEYRSLLGSTRPDIAYATAHLGQFASKATAALCRLAGYLVNTIQFELKYKKGDSQQIEA
ncbi:hypothetical protein HDU80_003550 [Chytriomyces hyalinus]|nr:hypothetical protein HDU80_003550 [Chytriomyces hyalinus]